jgi:release factor glutamine methyltransferase
MPTVKELLAQARIRLSETEMPSLDARLLLQHVTGLSHGDVAADPDCRIDADVVTKFDALVARRAAYEPVTRILELREFYGRNFRVTPDVLDPRADTETVVEVCLGLMPVDAPLRILDLGTGSGILAITLLAERKQASGLAIDVSTAALAVAKQNAALNGVVDRLHFVESSWFLKVKGKFDLIVSNPPYIPAADISKLDVEVKDHDPHLALVGGQDGLECYRAIAMGTGEYLAQNGSVVVEIGARQADDVIQIFAKYGFVLFQRLLDLGGHVRCLAFRPSPEIL